MPVTEIEIGRAKRARRAYSFDDIAIVPSRRTRDPEEVSVAWQIDAYRFELPVLAAPMDSVMSPETAIALGKLGGLGVLNLEGLWTRYDDPTPLLEEVAGLRGADATARMQEIYAEPIQRRADHRAAARDPRGRRHRRGRAVAAAHQGVREDRRRRGRRHVRHPRHHRLRRARLQPGRAAEPQGVHLRARRAGDRRRLRDVPGGAAPDAHRRGRRAGRLRRRRGAHHPHRPRRRGADGLRGGRRGRRPARLHGRVRRPLRARHRRRLDRPLGRHRQGDRLRCRRGDGRLAVRPRHRRARPRLPLGRRGAPRRAAPRRAGRVRAPSARWRRSCSGPPGSPTAP